MAALVIAEHDNAHVKGATLNTVTAASQMGGEVHVLIAGHTAQGAAQAAQIAGVTKVIHRRRPWLRARPRERRRAGAGAGRCLHPPRLPRHRRRQEHAPRVAATLDVGQVSDITKVLSLDTFERPTYAGNAIATVQATDDVKVITVRTTGFDAAPANGGSATIETATDASQQRRYLGSEIAKNDRPS